MMENPTVAMVLSLKCTHINLKVFHYWNQGYDRSKIIPLFDVENRTCAIWTVSNIFDHFLVLYTLEHVEQAIISKILNLITISEIIA